MSTSSKDLGARRLGCAASGSWRSGAASNFLSLAISIAALALAILAWMLPRVAERSEAEPWKIPGRGLSAYDLSTPEKAMRAKLEMERDADLRALMEYEMASLKTRSPDLHRELSSLKVDRTVECDGKVAIFCAVGTDGKPRHDVCWVQKSADGNYLPAYVSTYDWEAAGGAKAELARQIRAWEIEGMRRQSMAPSSIAATSRVSMTPAAIAVPARLPSITTRPVRPYEILQMQPTTRNFKELQMANPPRDFGALSRPVREIKELQMNRPVPTELSIPAREFKPITTVPAVHPEFRWTPPSPPVNLPPETDRR